MNLESASKIIRLLPNVLRPKSGANFVPQPDAGGRALLEKESTGSSRLDAGGISGSGRSIRKTLLLGIDFGAHQTRLLAEFPGVEQLYLNRKIPSVVAMLKPGDGKTLSPFLYFGEEAERKNDNFESILPWQNGEIMEPMFAREFARHVRGLMQREETLNTRAIVAAPMTLSADGRQEFRLALRGLFDEVIFLPRPYLSALGLKLKTTDARPTIVLDLGAGSTEVCRVGDRYPEADEMGGIRFGGDHVDRLIAETLRREYPALVPDLRQIRSWKDNFGYVGSGESAVVVKISIDGTEQSVALSNALRRGCDVWVTHMVELLKPRLAKSLGDVDVEQTVFVCGGGSRMSGLGPMLTRVLNLSGHESVSVEIADEEGGSLSALGALEAARKVREEQWIEFRT